MSARPTLVLVDALTTGAMLARMAAADHRIVHVRSRAALPETFAASLPAEVFAEDLTYPGHAEDVVRHLRALRPVAVIAASEFGIEVADELASRLGLRGNDPALSTARRDKFRMMEVLAAAGVPTSRQQRGSDLAALLDWWRASGLDRVVVKPLDSAGSEDVYTCDTEEEVAAAFRAGIGKTNLMLSANEEVLIQEHLAGDEYVVNSVSRDGGHWFTDAWISRKRITSGKRLVYDYEDLLAPDAPELDGILSYVGEVLDGLAVTDGPAHTELILTADGPRLLETGARLSGLANPPALHRCTGADQVTLTLDCHSPDAARLRGRPRRYERHESARCVNLLAHRELPLPARAVEEALAGLPAFQSIRFRKPEGTVTRPTVDLNSSPGVVFLVHRDPAEIENSYKLLREIERELL
ncbi:ATP-grasp domain-containing protein [Streptomyces sp. YU58]|uniref:ATP-grasp domain-containing protein n=1 Tax=Streptomyces sp. SX92 TaxID=3158972 RepID=UPI0027BAB16C|nr:ATP-grasp domain-containing protein [Streptomyces coralus]WLW53080.1 ATP-grasp domain-containing protein [Streptomyces coralus]